MNRLMIVIYGSAACLLALAGLTFTPKVQRLLNHADTVRMVSPISFTEIAIKANRGLTPLTRKHIEKLIFDLT